MILKSVNKKEIYGAEDCFGSPTNSSTIAEFISYVVPGLIKNQYDSGLYHLTDKGRTSRYNFIKEILKNIKNPTAKLRKVRNSFFDSTAQRPKDSSLDTSRIEQKFSYPLPSWKEKLSSELNLL